MTFDFPALEIPIRDSCVPVRNLLLSPLSAERGLLPLEGRRPGLRICPRGFHLPLLKRYSEAS